MPGTAQGPATSDAPRPSPMRIAARSLASVLRNPAIRSLELSWTIGVGVDWALLVVSLVVAYGAGGAFLVGLVSLIRMLPAMAVNVLVDTSAQERPERSLVVVNLVRAAGAAAIAAAVVAGQPGIAFAALAVASAAGALVRPTTLALLPSVAVRPEELVSANTAGALGESVGTFLGPLFAGIVIARAGPASAAALAAAAGVIGAVVVVGVHVAPAARVARGDRVGGLPLVAGIRELVRRRPAGVVMSSFGVQVLVRGALTTFIAVLAIDTLDMGDAGIGVLGAALGAGGIVGAALAVGLGSTGGLAGMFAVALIAWGAPILLIGIAPSPTLAIVALGVVGIGNALLDVSGLTLLQRGTSNAARGAVFAVVEVVAGLGVSIGAIVASGLVASIGIQTALIVTGMLLPVVAIAGRPWVARLDHEGVIPDRQARLLRGIPLFAPLPLAALERVAGGMREVHFETGDRLMTQGDAGDAYVVLEHGTVQVIIDGQPTHRQGPGDGIGEIALLHEVPRTATVTALEAVDAFEIDCETFVAAVTGHEGSRAAAREVVQSRLGSDVIDAPDGADDP